jgi:hypothetical protein
MPLAKQVIRQKDPASSVSLVPKADKFGLVHSYWRGIGHQCFSCRESKSRPGHIHYLLGLIGPTPWHQR